MNPPIMLRIASRPITLLRPYHPPKVKMTPSAVLIARKFSASTRRPFIDECLLGTHSLISGIHSMTGLPWAATIPLIAFLVRICIISPLSLYSSRMYAKSVKMCPRLIETRTAIEKSVEQQHGNKSHQERQNIVRIEFRRARKRLLKENGIQPRRTWIIGIKVPIWFAMMETIRRMTGTEDGMLSLISKPSAAFGGKENPGPCITDEVIPIEPSLATEGMLWFDNLMIPDSTMILPFALSGLVYAMYAFPAGTHQARELPLATQEHADKVRSFNQQRRKYLKLGALAIGPATLMFPSAMLLYWVSGTLAALMAGFRYRLLGMLLQVVRDSPTEKKPDEDKPRSKTPTTKYYLLKGKRVREQKMNKK